MIITRLKSLIPQFSKFLVVGGLNTVIDFAVFNALSIMFSITAGIGFAVITSISFVIANINSYFFNKNWTFSEASHNTTFIEKNDTVKFGEFFSVSIVGLLINASTVLLITTLIPSFFGITFFRELFSGHTALIWANLAKIVAIGLSLMWNFIGYKFIVFKK